MSPDERIKELKKQGYISGVMAGNRNPVNWKLNKVHVIRLINQ